VNGKGEARELGLPLGESECSGLVPNGASATRRVPSPAVAEKPKRRSFTPEYKARIVEEADACTQPGEIGALLRREGVYSSHLVDWRREYRIGAAERLSGRRRGPKGKDPLVRQKEELEGQVARLQQRLRQAEKIIEVQKKVSELLGIPLMEGSDP
jgi:transposase